MGETISGRWPWARSLRFRLTAWFTGALALVLASMCLLIYVGARHALRAETDAFLRSEARYFITAMAGESGERSSLAELVETISAQRPGFGEFAPQGRNPTRGRPFLAFDVVYVRVVSTATHATIAATPALARAGLIREALERQTRGLQGNSGTTLSYVVPSEEDTLRVLTQPIGAPSQRLLIQIAAPWDHNEDILEHLTLALVGVLFVLLFAVAAGGWLLVGKTLQPINRVVLEARRLDPRELPTQLLPPPAENDSEIGELVDTLNQMTTRLHDAFETERRFAEAQQRFAADASHELRTPLTVLRGGLELAVSRRRTIEYYRSTIETGIAEIERMSHIVEGLAFLARNDIEQPGALLKDQSVDFDGMILKLIEAVRRAAAARGVSVVHSDAVGRPISLTCSEVQLQQLFANLLDNAVKYTPSGGKVDITTRLVEDAQGFALTVRVADTGVGISADDLPHVFERFWRADRSRTSGGTGLGLAICRQIAQAHGGKLSLESELGVGTTAQLALRLLN